MANAICFPKAQEADINKMIKLFYILFHNMLIYKDHDCYAIVYYSYPYTHLIVRRLFHHK